jgi:hypothetical protein
MERCLNPDRLSSVLPRLFILLVVSHLISLATMPDLLARDHLIVLSYAVALLILSRACGRVATNQHDSIGDRGIA